MNALRRDRSNLHFHGCMLNSLCLKQRLAPGFFEQPVFSRGEQDRQALGDPYSLRISSARLQAAT
jgi:hypothetical protein